MWQSLMPRLSEQVVWGDTPHGSFHGSDLIDCLLATWMRLERSIAQICGWTKLGGRAGRVGNRARIPKALNKLELWNDPKRWCLLGTSGRFSVCPKLQYHNPSVNRHQQRSTVPGRGFCLQCCGHLAQNLAPRGCLLPILGMIAQTRKVH